MSNFVFLPPELATLVESASKAEGAAYSDARRFPGCYQAKSAAPV